MLFDEIRSAYNKTKKFVAEHPTLAASVATGVIGYRFGNKAALKSFGKTFGDEIAELTEMVYAWGNEAGVLELQRNILIDFVNTKELADEVREHLAKLA